jgi:16S rRNA (guanine527-N7)-methyltransferase
MSTDWAIHLARLGVEPHASAEQGAQLAAYERDLLRFGRGRNLISRRDPEAELRSLLAESIAASLLYPVESSSRLADLGSGAGLPGLVWAILRPAQSLTLIERRLARADFLERECRALRLESVRVLAKDAREVLQQEGFSGFDVVLAKAVANPELTLELGRLLLRQGGELLLFGRPNRNPVRASALAGWSHRELALSPDPSGPGFAAAALHCFRRIE